MEVSAAQISPSAGIFSPSSFIVTWDFMTRHIPGDKTRCAVRDQDSVVRVILKNVLIFMCLKQPSCLYAIVQYDSHKVILKLKKSNNIQFFSKNCSTV